jgi:hypothetical protein
MLTREYQLVFVFLVVVTLEMLLIATKLLVDRKHDRDGTVGLLY